MESQVGLAISPPPLSGSPAAKGLQVDPSAVEKVFAIFELAEQTFLDLGMGDLLVVATAT